MTTRGPSTEALYSIAVAARLAEVGEQTLRLYESRGLLTPVRTAGGTRRYSDHDVAVLRHVVELLAAGLNLAGARRVIQLETDNALLRERIAALTRRSARPAD